MARRRFCWIQGGAVAEGFKALLRTGDFPNYQFWVGGDRAVPFGPLPVVSTGNPEIWPRTIMAVGPGLDDWVVCYHNSGGINNNNNGINVAFANATGIIFTRTVPSLAQPDPVMTTYSKGIFASHQTSFLFAPNIDRRFRYTTAFGDVEPEPKQSSGVRPAFTLPQSAQFIEEAGAVAMNMARWGIINPTMDQTVTSQNTTPKTQFQFILDAATNTISPELPINFFFEGVVLVGSTLYRFSANADGNGGLRADETDQSIDDVIAVQTHQFQMGPGGTWEDLGEIILNYQSNASYRRIDYSFWAPLAGGTA